MIVWVLIFYAASGAIVIDNIRAQANCEALATVITADAKALSGLEPPHRCIAVTKR